MNDNRFRFDYECWHDGRFAYYVLASSSRTGRQAMLWVDVEGAIREVDWTIPQALVKLTYPVEFGKLSWKARIAVRLWVQTKLDSYRPLSAR